MARKHRLIDCNPRWGTEHGTEHAYDGMWLTFDCPEGHEGCRISIPITPTLDGATHSGGWERVGDKFEALTLRPSIQGVPLFANREAAIAAGRIAEHLRPRMFCAVHVVITNGAIEFCPDSR